MSQRHPPRPAGASVLIGLLAFLGFSGLSGGAAFIAAPDGHRSAAPREWLDSILLSEFLLPGLLLFFVIGVLSLLVAAALFWRPAWPSLQRLSWKNLYWGWTAVGLASVGILAFTMVELSMIPFGWLQAIYLGAGVAVVWLALTRDVREYYRIGDRRTA